MFIELEFMRSFLEDQLFESVKEKLNDVHGKINNLIWREGYQTIMSTLFDEITKGNFSNAENFSHVIMPLGKNKVSYQLANDIRGTNFDILQHNKGLRGLVGNVAENTIFWATHIDRY